SGQINLVSPFQVVRRFFQLAAIPGCNGQFSQVNGNLAAFSNPLVNLQCLLQKLCTPIILFLIPGNNSQDPQGVGFFFSLTCRAVLAECFSGKSISFAPLAAYELDTGRQIQAAAERGSLFCCDRFLCPFQGRCRIVFGQFKQGLFVGSF